MSCFTSSNSADKRTKNRTPVKLAALGGVVALGLGMAACSSDGEQSADSKDEVQVLTTFTILADMTKEIAGDELTVESLTRPGAEIHGYDPTPSDIKAASQADVIIANGLGLEHWLDKLTGESDATRVVASDGVEPMEIEGISDPNPHAWMSPKAAEIYVDNIVKALSDYKPDAADTFKENGDHYKGEIQKVGDDMLEGLSELPDNERALVTCEGAFSYLARDAGLKEGYIWPVNSEEEITPGNLNKAANFVKENKVPAVFCESTVEQGPKEQLMRDTGARDGGTLYVDSLTEKGGDAPTYLDLLRYDTTTIVEGLRG